MGPGMLGDAGRLEAVGEHLVQGGLAAPGAGEACLAGVEAQTDVAAGAVEPVAPVGVDVDCLDGEAVGGSGAGGRPDGGLELLCGVADLGGGLLYRDRPLPLAELI